MFDNKGRVVCTVHKDGDVNDQHRRRTYLIKNRTPITIHGNNNFHMLMVAIRRRLDNL
jgi:hypothetical protein